jgi:hypothetical protein
MLKARSLVVVVVGLAVVLGASSCTKRKKKRALVDAGFVDVFLDAGVVDAGVVDAGVGDAGVADAGVVDGGVGDAGVVDAGSVDGDAGVTVVEEGCAAERREMAALLVRAKAEPAAALSSSKALWGTGVCRMDTAIRFGRADLLLATVDVTAELSAKKDLLAESAELKPVYATYLRLGDACDAINDGTGALDAWQHALSLAPKSRQWFVSAKIEELQKKLAVEERFESRQGQHFVARYEGDERKDLADLALAILDNTRTSLERTLGVVPPVPITVVLYTGDQYSRSSSGPDWSGGVFDGKIRIRESQLKANRGTLEDILFHEYLHALLRTTVAAPVPAWFNEGLAQWVEPDGDKDEIAARMKQKRRDELPSLAVLTRNFGGVSDRKEVRVRYDSAFDLVVELEQWRTARSFAEMFKLMTAGKRFEEAFDEVYGMNLEVFESRWKSRYR